MIEKVFQFLGVIAVLIFIGLVTYILISYVDLSEFKKCYDTNFHDTYCKKYINY